MAIRLYFLPTQMVDVPYTDVGQLGRVPAYIYGQTGYQARYFGAEPWCFVVVDITEAEHNQLRVRPGVISLPQPHNIGNVVGGQLVLVQEALEEMNVPADWVTANHTYRGVLRTVLGMFKFVSRIKSFARNRMFPAGVTLNTRFNELTSVQRQRLTDAADHWNIDRSSLTANSTMRQILYELGRQMKPRLVRTGQGEPILDGSAQ